MENESTSKVEGVSETKSAEEKKPIPEAIKVIKEAHEGWKRGKHNENDFVDKKDSYVHGFMNGYCTRRDESPSVVEQNQDELWKELYMDFQYGEGWIAFTNRMKEQFTITRKSQPL